MFMCYVTSLLKKTCWFIEGISTNFMHVVEASKSSELCHYYLESEICDYCILDNLALCALIDVVQK